MFVKKAPLVSDNGPIQTPNWTELGKKSYDLTYVENIDVKPVINNKEIHLFSPSLPFLFFSFFFPHSLSYIYRFSHVIIIIQYL